MYSTMASFLEDWKAESAATLKIMKALTDASLSRAVSGEGRSLGRIAWHIATTLGEMGGKAGLPVTSPAEDAEVPAHAAEIVVAYETASRSLAEQAAKLWTDGMLKDELSMYGITWTRTAVLASLVRHQIHHRGQMTVLMRQAGLSVPGVYGPSREEWAGMGMKAQP